MKIRNAIIAAALLFAAGCGTTGNTTGSTSSTGNVGTAPAMAGTSTSGSTNPATTSTNARGTLTEGSTASGSGTTTSTSASTSSGSTIVGTTTNANNANSAGQSASTPATTSSNTATMNGTTSPATNANSSTMNAGASGTTQAGTNTSISQTTTANNGLTTGAFSVPSSHQTAFSTRYPRASNVQWSRYSSTDVPIDWELTDWTRLDNDDYVVRYDIGTDAYYSWYDAQGNWVGTSGTMKNTSGLPAAINTMLASKYKGYTISSANTEYWKDRTAYEIEMKNASTKVKLLVDANGNVIKEKTKTQ